MTSGFSRPLAGDELLNSGQQRRWVSVGLDEPDGRVGLA